MPLSHLYTVHLDKADLLILDKDIPVSVLEYDPVNKPRHCHFQVIKSLSRVLILYFSNLSATRV